MANPTTNYSFAMPTNTDLVKDLPADFEVFGQAVDTQMKTNADAAIAKTIVDAKGDIIAATAADTVSRLAVGANDTVLTADSSTATGLKWATVSTSSNYSLVNSGGTALTGAATVTVSGITGADKLLVLIDSASSANASSDICIRFNTDTGNNYYRYGPYIIANAAYSSSIVDYYAGVDSNIVIGRMPATNAGRVSGALMLFGGNSAGQKVFSSVGSGNPQSSNSQIAFILQGYYDSASTISSVSAFSSSGNFDNGTLYVYKSA